MVLDLFKLDGKVALITGSSQGLGLTFARALAEAGATVVLNSRSADKLDKVVAEFRENGFKAYGSAFDVSKKDEVEPEIDRIEKEVGPIDILVNNAGIQRRAPLHEATDEQWKDVLDTNLNGVFVVSRKVARSMIERRRGKIINTCSLMCELGRAGTAPYAAAKGGVRQLVHAMCVDWAQYNIQVNGIGPGYFKTEMNKPLYTNPDFDKWVVGRTPSRRWGEPEELTGALMLLASDAGSFINGQIIYVDGGILSAL